MKTILAATLVVFSSFVYSNTASDKTIATVHVHSSSGIYFAINDAFINPFNCSQQGMYKVKESSNYEKEILSILLAAKMANKQINFHIHSICSGGYSVVDWVNTHD